MRPDGTAAATCWGNQSVYPDHLGEARQIPGSGQDHVQRIRPSRRLGRMHRHRRSEAGPELPARHLESHPGAPWPEVGDGPVPTPGVTTHYHTSGQYAAYKTPYPLSEELFLVSARTGDLGGGFMHSAHDPTIGKFKLYLMDIYGNRELIYEGDQNVLYAQPVRPRKSPPLLPDLADLPGSEQNAPTVRAGVFFSNNIFDGAPAEVREQGRYLRVVESMPKNYSIGIVSSGGKPFGSAGPDTAWGAWGERFLPGQDADADHRCFVGRQRHLLRSRDQPHRSAGRQAGPRHGSDRPGRFGLLPGPALPDALFSGARRAPAGHPHDAFLGFGPPRRAPRVCRLP